MRILAEERYRRRVQIERPIDTIISTECLEHDEHWRETLAAIYEYVKPGGLILITAAGVGRPEHGTTENAPEMSPGTNGYYSNISNAMMGSVYWPQMFKEYFLRQCGENFDMNFFGIKKKS